MVYHSEEYPEALGYTFSTTSPAAKSIQMSAAEPPSINFISSVQLEGLIIKGDQATSTPAKVLIYVKQAVSSTTNISFYIPDIINPS